MPVSEELQCDSAAPPANRHDLTPAHLLPRLSDFPIPANIRAGGKGWSEAMNEMAAFISPRSVLLICEQFGGQAIYIPRRKATNPFRHIVPPHEIDALGFAFGREQWRVPNAIYAISVARRSGLIAAVRAGQVSRRDAAIIMNTTRSYLSGLINGTDEGVGIVPSPIPERRELYLLREAAEIIGEELVAVGVPLDRIAGVRARILSLSD